MNDTFLFLIICSSILLLIVQYSKHTTELAVAKRWKFANFLKPILHNDEYSDEEKKFYLLLFSKSLDKNALPKVIFFGILFSLIFKKESKEVKDVNKLRDNKIFRKALALFFEVNFYNAIHWYVFFGLIFSILLLVIAIFSRLLKPFALLEKLLINSLMANFKRASF